jgi:hypothetical protein
MRAVNLIPGSDHGGPRIKVGRSGGGAYAVLGLLGGLALLVFLYGQASHQISSRHAQIASLEARVAQTQAQASELTPYTDFVSLREQRVDAVTQLVDSRFNWPSAFYELGRVLPASASIESLDGTVGASAGSGSSSSTASLASKAGSAASGSGSSSGSSSVSSATPPGSVPSFTLTGCAISQAAVALTLERLRLMEGVDEVHLQSSAKSGSSGAGGGSSSCAAGHVTFSSQVVFDALPNVPSSSTGSAATLASDSATAATPSGSSPSSSSSSAPSSSAGSASGSAASTTSPASTGSGAVR